MGDGKRLDYNYVKSEIEKIGYTLISKEYINASTKIICICNKGHVYETTYTNIQKGRRCRECDNIRKSKTQKLSSLYVSNYLKQYNYKMMSLRFKGFKSKITIKCPEGHVYKTSFANFKKGCRCMICKNNKKLIKYKKKIYEKSNYIVKTDVYINSKIKVPILCNKGHLFTMSLDNASRGERCPLCSMEDRKNKTKLSYDVVVNNIESKGYKLLEKDYINNNTKMKLMCPLGHVYKTTYGNFMQGKRCPKCYSSKGEDKIRKILIDYDVEFEEQYSFEDCRYKKKLRFDFYLSELNILIEFDGRQHYEEVFGKKEFENCLKRDKIKNEYCAKNNIPLIRISYLEYDNIEIIIKNIIDK